MRITLQDLNDQMIMEGVKTMKTSRKVIALCCVALLAIPLLTACSSNNNNAPQPTATAQEQPAAPAANAPDLSKEVNIVCYLYGNEGVANPDIIAAINEKLKADLNCTLEIKYIDWGDVSTKYPLLFTAGEKFDMAYASPVATISYYTLAAQGLVMDITNMLDVVPDLKAAIDEKTWSTTKLDGKIYGVPCTYSEFIPYGYAYRADLREEYGLDTITSLETMEAYMQAVADNESFAPINGNSIDAMNLYRMFVDMTSGWIPAPGVPNDSLYLVGESKDDFKSIISPAFTDEFAQWCEKMREWNDAGYWPTDILASETTSKDNMLNGISAGFTGHMTDWTGAYGSYKTSLPGISIDWWGPAVDTGKVATTPGVNNTTVISSTSENPERTLMVIEKLMTDESYYNLLQYGIEGRQYEIKDGMVVQPDGYDQAKDGFGFAGWAFRTDKFNIPMSTEDPRRYELIEEWKATAMHDPFVGFSFDPVNVSNEIAAVVNVNSTLGYQLMLGKTQADVASAVEDYRTQLKNAGIDKIIDELTTQMADFTPVW